jgi:mannose-1-phosphate guanylyltransferase
VARHETGNLWGVVLAAGEGRRLASLTSALYGRELPKQFAAIEGERSLLQTTLHRIAPLIPAHRTVVVVARDHEELARRQLDSFPGAHLVSQPRNLDTGPGILLPLAWILATESSARIAVFPSDHYVARPAPFLQAVREADAASDFTPGLVTLLGVVPDRPETEYGWIVPGPPLGAGARGSLFAVRRFVEKPARELALRLLCEAGLWSSFISLGRLSAFWRLASLHLPEQAALLRSYSRAVGTARAAGRLDAIYHRMPAANFSRAILERADRLAVAPVRGSGWSDWGSPSRIFRSLEGTRSLEVLQGRMALHSAAPVFT